MELSRQKYFPESGSSLRRVQGSHFKNPAWLDFLEKAREDGQTICYSDFLSCNVRLRDEGEGLCLPERLPAPLTFASTSAAVCLVTSRFSTKAVSPRKFPDAEERQDSRLSSNVLRVILNPFCCFVRSDCKYQVRELGRKAQSILLLGWV